ncbi:MAG TPA: MMPL family transporter [Burkholderiaceae bacterium]|jgi:predicted exporter
MNERRTLLPLLVWLAVLACCAWIVGAHTKIYTDLTGFLPSAPDRTQQLLLDQLREGPSSRLILIGVEGGRVENLAGTSFAMAEAMRKDTRFSLVQNGELEALDAEREILTRYRYALTPALGPGGEPDHFGVEAMRKDIARDAALLQSSFGDVLKSLLPLDPTGEVARIAASMTPGSKLALHDGVWFSADGRRALLIAQTAASGMDAVQQQDTVSALRAYFAAAVQKMPPADAKNLRLLLSGTPVFAAESRRTIEQDSWRLSAIAGVLVLFVLLLVYRSAAMTALAFVPVASGLLAGVAVVSLWFGGVHGITLAFGATLVGEAVDYPNYAFLHTARGEAVQSALRRIGPTLRLAVLTTVLSSTALLLSSFSGLAQLGLLSLTGVAVAGLTTRFILPLLAGNRFTGRKTEHLPFVLAPGHRWRRAVLPLLLIACAVLVWRGSLGRLWDDDLASLSPVSTESKLLDQELRTQLGAPDIRHVLVIAGSDSEQVLRSSEAIEADLRDMVGRGVVNGYDMAAHYLPSRQLQAQRLAALPDAASLQRNLKQALQGSPFRDDAFEPFLHDIDAARRQAPLQAADLRGTSLELKVQSLLLHDQHGTYALVTLRGVADEAKLQLALTGLRAKGVVTIDLKDDTGRLVNGYRDQSLRLSALGLLLIALLLLVSLRSLRATAKVLYPVLAGTTMCAAFTIMRGEKLTLFHLVAFLLVIGIGLNYALFFNRREPNVEETRRNHFSLAICSLTTFLSFGTLMLSRIPVLHAIGQTVALGSLLCLVCACVLAPDFAQQATRVTEPNA